MILCNFQSLKLKCQLLMLKFVYCLRFEHLIFTIDFSLTNKFLSTAHAYRDRKKLSNCGIKRLGLALGVRL